MLSPSVYLSPDFDPTKVTMANLREIFIKYDIQYPTTAKKADLVDIFKTHVAPKAKEFLKLESGMPSDAGIVDAPKRGKQSPSKRDSSPTKSSPTKSSPSKSSPLKSPRKLPKKSFTALKKELTESLENPPSLEVPETKVKTRSASPPKSPRRSTRKLAKPFHDIDEDEDLTAILSTPSAASKIRSKAAPVSTKKKPSTRKVSSSKSVTSADASEQEDDDDKTTLDAFIKYDKQSSDGEDIEDDVGEHLKTPKSKRSSRRTTIRSSNAVKDEKDEKKHVKEIKEEKEDDEIKEDHEEKSSAKKHKKAKKTSSINGTHDVEIKSPKTPKVKSDPDSKISSFVKPSSILSTPVSKKPSSAKTTPSKTPNNKTPESSHKKRTFSNEGSSGGSPFTEVNPFQASPKVSKRKRHSTDNLEPEPKPKKRESIAVSTHKNNNDDASMEGIEIISTTSTVEHSLATPNPSLERRSSSTRTTPNKRNSVSTTPRHENEQEPPQLVTPDQQKTFNRVPPPTAPPARSHGYFMDNGTSSRPDLTAYSTGKPLKNKESSRRISFMPSITNLRMSEAFSRELQEKGYDDVDGEQDETFVSVMTSSYNEPLLSPTPNHVINVDSDENEDEEEVAASVEEESSEEVEEDDEEEEEETEEVQLKKLKNEVDQEAEAFDEHHKLLTPKAQEQLLFGLKVFGVVLSLIFASTSLKWLYDQQYEAGYCDIGFVQDPSWHRIKTHYSEPQDWKDYFNPEYLKEKSSEVLDHVRPKCKPCPEHAVCMPNFETVCEEGFVKINSPFSLGGFLPIPPTCVPDTRRQQRIERLTRKALQMLRERNAKYACGDKSCPTAEYEESELRDALYAMKAESLSDEEFDDLWRHAINEVEKDNEVIVRTVDPSYNGENETVCNQDEGCDPIMASKIPLGSSQERYLKTNSLANISFSCAVRRSVSGLLERYRIHIGLLLTLVFLSFSGYKFYKDRKERLQEAERLSELVYDKLKKQLSLYKNDETGRQLPFVAIVNLRDSLLGGISDYKTRAIAWKDVENIVNKEANVRYSTKEIHGDLFHVWEWIGDIGDISLDS